MKKLSKSAISALVLFTMVFGTSFTLSVVFTTAAYAQKGANGNGQGNGNTRSERSGNENRNNTENGNRQANNSNGQGAIASELKGLNAAHASQTALLNASPESMPGKLYAFQQASLLAAELETQANEKADFYAALMNMSEERFYELNPDLDYETTLATAAAEYQATIDAQSNADAQIEQTLMALTDGRVLSEAAMEELRLMLGL